MMVVDDFFAYGQPYACSLVVRAIQPLEDAEYLFAVLRLKSDAVVLRADAMVVICLYA